MLIDEVGGNVHLAEIVGMSPNQVGQLKSSRGQFGIEVCERLERAMGRPSGWMDQWLPEEGGWPEVNRSKNWPYLKIMDELSDEAQKAIRSHILASRKQESKTESNSSDQGNTAS